MYLEPTEPTCILTVLVTQVPLICGHVRIDISTYCFTGQTTTVQLTVRPAENYPVDLYYLMDMSFSMNDDLEKLTKLASKIGTNHDQFKQFTCI